jgi:PAS domain S-box-containing protein
MDKLTAKLKAGDYIREEMDKRNYRFLKITLILVSIVFLGLLGFNIVTHSEFYKYTNWIYTCISVISISLVYILKAGYRKIASYTLILLTWSGMIFFIWSGKSYLDAANEAILVIVLFAALLINRRAALIVAIVSLLNYLVIIYFSAKGTFQPQIPPPYNMARDYVAIMGATIALVLIYERTMQTSVSRIADLLIQKDTDKQTISNYELNYQEIFESINDAIFIHDATNGDIIDINLSACSMFGYQKNEFTRLSIDDLSAVDEGYTREFALNKIQEAIKEGYSNFEWRSRRANGRNFWTVVQLKSSFINGERRVLAVVRDNNEVKSAQLAMRSSEERLRATLEITPNVAIQWYNSNGVVIYWNKASELLYGYKTEEAIGKTLDQLIYTKEEAENFLKIIDEINISGNKVGPYESSIITKSGETRTILSTNFSIPDENGKKLFVCMDVDITQQKVAEAKIQIMNDNLELKVQERTCQLEKANKDIEAFAYSISHDLRAPLRHIEGFTKQLFSNIPEPGENVVNYYNRILKSSGRMTGMIEDLLNYSRIGRKEILLSSVNLFLLVNDIIDSIKSTNENRVINWKVNGLPVVRADKNLMKVVFENLISNAVKYTSRREIAEIEIGCIQSDENFIDIYVKDNGAGFNMDFYDKLFRVFQRLHTIDEFEGTGIGLANVKQIVNRHNGNVKAFGEIDKGATFYISLPL